MNKNKKTCALILCAGKGVRSRLSFNKIFHYFGKKTIIEMTLDAFIDSNVEEIVLVISPNDEERINDLLSESYNYKLCYGGETRCESVKNGLFFIDNCEIVVIHDAARPFLSKEIINSCIESAQQFGSGIAAVKAVDTIKRVNNGIIISNIEREGIYQIQTPQAFNYSQIQSSYNDFFKGLNSASSKEANINNSDHSPSLPTDDSEIYLRAGYTPRIVEGSYDNIKVTSSSDLFHLNSSRLKIGTGFDVHQLVEGRRLILGGEIIPHTMGLLGHSDADVLVHAIMDALLSAAGLPDIGVLFPDTDKNYKDISSLVLLSKVGNMLASNNLIIRNISSVIMAEKPRLSPYTAKMRENIFNTLCIDPLSINISATTTEGLGIIGRGQGIASSATCLLEKN